MELEEIEQGVPGKGKWDCYFKYSGEAIFEKSLIIIYTVQ